MYCRQALSNLFGAQVEPHKESQMNALRFVLMSTFAACSLANAGTFEKVSEAKKNRSRGA